jgi:hypothetical protein
MKDYSITMQDNSGRTCVVFINSGETESNARMSVEDNAVANAIHRGEISSGAWLVATSEVTA